MRCSTCSRTVDAGQHDSRCPVVQDPAHPDPGVGLHPDHGRHAVRAGGRDDIADLFLTAGAVLQIEQQPVEPGSGADLGGERGRGAQEGAQGGCPRRGPPGPGRHRSAESSGAAHPNHRWVLRSCSYSARSGGTVQHLGHLGGSDVPPHPGRRQVGVRDRRDHDDDRAGVSAGVVQRGAEFVGGVGPQRLCAETGGDLDQVDREVVAAEPVPPSPPRWRRPVPAAGCGSGTRCRTRGRCGTSAAGGSPGSRGSPGSPG